MTSDPWDGAAMRETLSPVSGLVLNVCLRLTKQGAMNLVA